MNTHYRERHRCPLLRSVATVALMVGSACATTSPEFAAPPLEDAAFFGADGAPMRSSVAMDRIEGANARHVYVGERHGDSAFHRAQLAVIAGLRARGKVAVGVEWLGRDQQPALDAFLVGETDWAEFDAAARMKKRWGKKAAAFHRWILGYCKTHGIPVVALNAPDGLARTVARGGPEAVPEEGRRWLPPLDTGNPEHKAYFQRLMTRAGGHGGGAHKMTPGMLERYYRAQLVWDESMAIATHEALSRFPGHTVIVLAGLGHVDFGHGIPLRVGTLAGASPAAKFVIVRPLGPGEPPPIAGQGPFPAKIADLFVRMPAADASQPIEDEAVE